MFRFLWRIPSAGVNQVLAWTSGARNKPPYLFQLDAGGGLFFAIPPGAQGVLVPWLKHLAFAGQGLEQCEPYCTGVADVSMGSTLARLFKTAAEGVKLAGMPAGDPSWVKHCLTWKEPHPSFALARVHTGGGPSKQNLEFGRIVLGTWAFLADFWCWAACAR